MEIWTGHCRLQRLCMFVCCVCPGGGGVLPFLPGLPGWTCMATLASSGRIAPHYSRPTVQVRGASLYCPSTSAFCDCFPHLPCTSVKSHSVSYCQTSPDSPCTALPKKNSKPYEQNVCFWQNIGYALRPEPGALPQDHPGSGVMAPWLPPGQLHGNISKPVIAMLPRVLYVYWGFHSRWCSRQRGGLHGLLNLAISPGATARLQTCPIQGSIPRPFGCETYA